MPEYSAFEQPTTLRRLVYKEITLADRRKIIAKSNDTPSGGGARDFRFSPFEEFGDIFSRLFPEKRIFSRKAGAASTIFVGTFSWNEGGVTRHMESLFEPPTLSRPSEGRIANVHKYPCLANVPSAEQGMVILLLIQNADTTVWPQYVTEQELADPGWDRSVTAKIISCIRAQRSGSTVAGYIDFESGREFCNGR